MNNTVKSAIPVAVISAILVALFIFGYSFWFKEQVFKPFAERQQSDIESLRSTYEAQMQKVADSIMQRVDQTNHTPALLAPDLTLIEWNEVSGDQLQSVLDTHRPVCWKCHTAETFRRRHPDLVIDNPFAPLRR